MCLLQKRPLQTKSLSFKTSLKGSLKKGWSNGNGDGAVDNTLASRVHMAIWPRCVSEDEFRELVAVHPAALFLKYGRNNDTLLHRLVA